ncbi:MAG: G/U mismatch-specific DNA glycosylase [Kitasatospora sp.]|nr:G/U mismatch-specific DNA glycosylase [Kitasatospora sp.]
MTRTPPQQRPAAGARPTPEQLAAAQDSTIEDVAAPGLRVLFCGINPGLWSGATGQHFARPGNRFWPALHRSGFTPRQLRPDEQRELLGFGLGITNVVARTTAKASELAAEEYREGGLALADRVRRLRPRALAVLGIGAYRAAFGRPRAAVGPQPEPIGGTEVWLLPNPSGLNAHYTLDGIAAEFRTLREHLERSER